MKKKTIKIIILLIILILLTFLIITGRKMLIISKLSNNANKNINSTNFHYTLYTFSIETGDNVISDCYVLNNKIKIETTWPNQKITQFGNVASDNLENEKSITNCYNEIDGKKYFRQIPNQSGMVPYNSVNYFETDNFLDLLKKSVTTSIKNKKLNGKNVYWIKGLKSNKTFYEANEFFIDTETGLVTLCNTENNIYKEKYEINTVTEEDFKEPDKTEYEIMPIE